MSDTRKRVTISVPVNVSLIVDVDVCSGYVDIVNVVAMNGLPSAVDVREGLDAAQEFQQLDDAYLAAGGELP